VDNVGSAYTMVACCPNASAPKATPALRKWWTDRYSADELRELAAGVWPDG
jgi:hypothetical protein